MDDQDADFGLLFSFEDQTLSCALCCSWRSQGGQQ